MSDGTERHRQDGVDVQSTVYTYEMSNVGYIVAQFKVASDTCITQRWQDAVDAAV